jgi:DNA modification methylase
MHKNVLKIEYVKTDSLKLSEFNPRIWTTEAEEQLTESIKRFDLIDPIIVNNAKGREGFIIGGNFRYTVAKKLGMETVPVVHITISDLAKEKELNIRLNKNTGDFDWNMLANLEESILKDIGFSSEELDEIFPVEETPEEFDLEKELKKLNIESITIKPGDVFDLDGSRLMCGNSMIEADVLQLFGDARADMCFTDPPYLLDYLKGKKKKDGKITEGFGKKRDRIYLGTESLPENFSDLWMDNIVKIQKPDFSIIVYENPKNLKTIWTALEKRWKYRNTIIWHIPNRVQGFSAKYKFFNKHDFAIVGTSGEVGLNMEPESDELFQNEYETAIYATSGKPTWESYSKGKKYCPTDFIEHNAGDKKSSGQEIIFGTKPLELLIPYIKVLTKRGDLIAEPYGGSGSTLIAATKMGRRCFLMEKSPVYATVILNRWSKLTGKQPIKIYGRE